MAKQEVKDLVPKSMVPLMREWRAKARDWAPHNYQERALKLLLEHPWFGLLLPPGMGKTSISLATVKVLLKRKLIKRALVIAPLRPCYDVWPAEVCDWTDFRDFRIALLHGPDKDRVLRSLTPQHQICLINPEGVPWLCSDKARMKLLDADMLIVDESSLWKNSAAVRFRALRKYIHLFKRRVILTGSPRPRHYLDLHGQIFLIDRGITLGEYLTHYRNRFFFPTGFEMREWEILPGAAEEIDALVAPLVLRLDAKDYLKLPNEMERTHRVDLPPKVRVEYDAIESKLINTLFDAPFVSSAAIRSKCAQIANGCVYLEEDGQEERWSKVRRWKEVHTAKVEAVVDLVNELQGDPLLLAIGYQHDVAALRKALGPDLPCINGQTTRGQAAEYIERWNRGELPVLLGHPASMGHGLNLQKCNARHVGYFDITDSYDLYDQFWQRVGRQGNKASFVMRHHFVVNNTVDVPKMRNLRAKASGQKAFLEAMKKYSEERQKGGAK